MELPTEDGAYVIVFGQDDYPTSTHGVDKYGGIWWDGSKIVSEDFIKTMLVNGTMYKAQLIPLANAGIDDDS